MSSRSSGTGGATRVLRHADLDALSRAAAVSFARDAAVAVAERGVFRAVLCGGTTPRTMYGLLAREPLRGRIPWRQVELFLGDERVVSGDDGTNLAMIRAALLDPLAPGGPRMHPIRTHGLDPAAAAQRYEEEIRRALASDRLFDLVLLGLGPDGHTASLFPGGSALRERRRWVAEQAGPPPFTQRVTLTPPALNAARRVHFLVSGPGKAAALAAALEGPGDPQRSPSRAIDPPEGIVTWYVDHAAAALLTSNHVPEEGR